MKKDNQLHILLLFHNFINVTLFAPLAGDKAGITASQLLCLRFLYLHPNATTSQLAKGLSISCGASSRLLDRLEQRGLLSRKTLSRDKRVQQLNLTPKGVAVVDKAINKLRMTFHTLLAKFTPEEQAAISSVINTILQRCVDTPQTAAEICLQCGILHTPDCPNNLQQLRWEKSVGDAPS